MVKYIYKVSPERIQHARDFLATRFNIVNNSDIDTILHADDIFRETSDHQAIIRDARQLLTRVLGFMKVNRYIKLAADIELFITRIDQPRLPNNNGWLPIDSPPKHGRYVLGVAEVKTNVGLEHRHSTGWYEKGEWRGFHFNSHCRMVGWQELTLPINETKEGE